MKSHQTMDCFFVLFSFPLTNDAFIHHKIFSFIMMSLLVRSLRDRFCMSRKAGPGGSGWVHPKGEKKQHGCVSYEDFCWSRMGHFSCFSYKLIWKTVSFICMASSSSILGHFSPSVGKHCSHAVSTGKPMYTSCVFDFYDSCTNVTIPPPPPSLSLLLHSLFPNTIHTGDGSATQVSSL